MTLEERLSKTSEIITSNYQDCVTNVCLEIIKELNSETGELTERIRDNILENIVMLDPNYFGEMLEVLRNSAVNYVIANSSDIAYTMVCSCDSYKSKIQDGNSIFLNDMIHKEDVDTEAMSDFLLNIEKMIEQLVEDNSDIVMKVLHIACSNVMLPVQFSIGGFIRTEQALINLVSPSSKLLHVLGVSLIDWDKYRELNVKAGYFEQSDDSHTDSKSEQALQHETLFRFIAKILQIRNNAVVPSFVFTGTIKLEDFISNKFERIMFNAGCKVYLADLVEGVIVDEDSLLAAVAIDFDEELGTLSANTIENTYDVFYTLAEIKDEDMINNVADCYFCKKESTE